MNDSLRPCIFSTPDGNKYFSEVDDRHLLDYIREKCGYDVFSYLEERLSKANSIQRCHSC